MSQVVDTKVVEMQFDNSKFEKNIQTSLNSLKFLNKSIEDAGKNRNSLDELAKAGDQVGLSFDNMSQKTRITVGLMDLLAGVGTKAFNRISDAVAGFAMNMANSLPVCKPCEMVLMSMSSKWVLFRRFWPALRLKTRLTLKNG